MRYVFSTARLFDRFKEIFEFLFIWVNMNHVQLHICWLNKDVALKLHGGVEFDLLAILDVRGYSKEI